MDIEEALGDFRAGATTKGYIFRLIDYTYSIANEGNGQVRKTFQGGFVVAHYYSNRNDGSADYHAAKRKAEQVTDEIIEKMIADSINGHPLFNHSFDSRQQINVTPYSAVSGTSYTGYLATFEWTGNFRDCVTSDDAPAWIDGGQTPFSL